MSLWSRFSLIFRSKASKALDRAEDPRETLDYSYQRQVEMLSKVRRGVADVATSRKRVELQVNQLTQQQTKLHQQAEKALAMGFSTHIGKPVNPDDLIAAIANLAVLVRRQSRP